jgi:hypothetical protein
MVAGIVRIPSEPTVQVCHRHAAHHGHGLAVSPGASSLVHPDQGSDSLTEVATHCVGHTPVEGSEDTSACVDMVAGVDPCMGHWKSGAPSSGLLSGQWKHEQVAACQDSVAWTSMQIRSVGARTVPLPGRMAFDWGDPWGTDKPSDPGRVEGMERHGEYPAYASEVGLPRSDRVGAETESAA